MLARVFLSASVLFAAASTAQAGHLSLPHTEGVATNDQGDNMVYTMMLPPGHDDPDLKLPLVLYLHGSGQSSGTNNTSQFGSIPDLVTVTQGLNSSRPCFRDPACVAHQPIYDKQFASYLLVPQAPPNAGWYQFAEILNGLIADAVATRNVEPSRIYVMGHSMGGFGTFAMLETHPETFAAAVPMAGGGNTSAVDLFKDVPVWLFHGDNDHVVSPTFSIDMHAALQAAGGDSQLTLIPQGGHVIVNGVLADQGYLLYSWMFDQQQAPVPEPGSLAVFALGGVLLASRRGVRRR